MLVVFTLSCYIEEDCMHFEWQRLKVGVPVPLGSGFLTEGACDLSYCTYCSFAHWRLGCVKRSEERLPTLSCEWDDSLYLMSADLTVWLAPIVGPQLYGRVRPCGENKVRDT